MTRVALTFLKTTADWSQCDSRAQEGQSDGPRTGETLGMRCWDWSRGTCRVWADPGLPALDLFLQPPLLVSVDRSQNPALPWARPRCRHREWCPHANGRERVPRHTALPWPLLGAGDLWEGTLGRLGSQEEPALGGARQWRARRPRATQASEVMWPGPAKH